MIRTIAIIVCTIVLTFVFGLTAIVTSFFGRSGNAVHLVARAWGRSILWVSRIKVSVGGLSNISPEGAYIFMANHLSNFDIPVLLAYLPAQFRWLAKAELFKIPVFGRAMRGAGYISIDRSDRRSAFKSLERAAETIRNGASVMIFPEGTRSRSGQLGSFKKGGFVLAVDAGVPVVPITIRGTWEIMSKKGLRIRPGRVHVQIHEPIDADNYTRKTKDALMESVRKAITGTTE